jgi:hypothetical protein
MMTDRTNRHTADRVLPALTAPAVRSLIALLAFSAMLSGCGTVTLSSTFREDGSASHQLMIVVSRSAVLERDIATIERELLAAEQRARIAGFQTQRINNPSDIGLRVTTTTRDATNTGLALNNLFNSLGAGPDEGTLAPFQGTFRRESEAVGGTAYALELTASGEVLFQGLRGLAPGNRDLETPEAMAQVVRFVYRARMPGTIRETTGTITDTSVAEWNLPLTETTTMTASSTVGRETPWLWITLAIVGALAVVVLAGVLVSSLLLRGSRSARPRLTHVDAATDPHIARANPVSLRDVSHSLQRLVKRVLNGVPVSSARRIEETERRDGAQPKGD